MRFKSEKTSKVTKHKKLNYSIEPLHLDWKQFCYCLELNYGWENEATAKKTLYCL